MKILLSFAFVLSMSSTARAQAVGSACTAGCNAVNKPDCAKGSCSCMSRSGSCSCLPANCGGAALCGEDFKKEGARAAVRYELASPCVAADPDSASLWGCVKLPLAAGAQWAIVKSARARNGTFKQKFEVAASSSPAFGKAFAGAGDCTGDGLSSRFEPELQSIPTVSMVAVPPAHSKSIAVTVKWLDEGGEKEDYPDGKVFDGSGEALVRFKGSAAGTVSNPVVVWASAAPLKKTLAPALAKSIRVRSKDPAVTAFEGFLRLVIADGAIQSVQVGSGFAKK